MATGAINNCLHQSQDQSSLEHTPFFMPVVFPFLRILWPTGTFPRTTLKHPWWNNQPLMPSGTDGSGVLIGSQLENQILTASFQKHRDTGGQMALQGTPKALGSWNRIYGPSA